MSYRHRRPQIWPLVVIIAAAGLLFQLSLRRQTTTAAKAGPIIVAPTLVPTPARVYSEGELQEFYNTHMSKWVAQISSGQYHIRAIQEEYSKLAARIVEKTGHPLSVNLSMAYDPASEDVLATTSGPNQEDLTLVIPAHKDKYNEFCIGNPNAEELFEALFVTSLLHEVQHVGYGHNVYRTKDGLMTDETATWMLTCSNVLSPLVTNGYTLDPSSVRFYASWLICKKDKACFRRFVESTYARVAPGFMSGQ